MKMLRVMMLLSLSIASCGGSSASIPAPSAAPSPSVVAATPPPAEPSPSPSPSSIALGTITLDGAGCSMTGVPEEIDPGAFELVVMNGTDGQAGFDFFRIGSPGSAVALAEHVNVERDLAKAGKPFIGPPVWAEHVVGSEIIEGGKSATLTGQVTQGTYGVVCLATYPDLKTDPIRPVASVAPIRVGVAPKTFVPDDVDSIVLGQADAPSGSKYDGGESGRATLTLPVWYMEAADQQRFHDLDGFLAGRSSGFAGSDPDQPLFVSVAIAFDSPRAASTVLVLYEREFRTTWGFTDLAMSDPELGDEGFRAIGHASVQDGEPGFYYFWRSNNLLLEAVGIGKVEGDAERAMGSAVAAIAREMEERTR